jgi:mannose-6-phosphate isomerase-like protein (cupin superfamily)
VITSDLSSAARVYGVHGADGLTYWKCLARPTRLAGPWEAVEWACLPPGAASGVHTHSRTEEIYYILAGEGELYLDGALHAVRPRSLVLTRAGGTHGLRNTDAGDLEWLVIEMSTPHTHAVLTGTRLLSTEVDMARDRSVVLHLAEEDAVDPTTVFDGPLTSIRLRALAAGETTALTAADVEHVMFVLDGEGRVTGGGGVVPLARGTAVTVPLGDEAVVTAGPGPLRVFHAMLQVTSPDRGTVALPEPGPAR